MPGCKHLALALTIYSSVQEPTLATLVYNHSSRINNRLAIISQAYIRPNHRLAHYCTEAS